MSWDRTLRGQVHAHFRDTIRRKGCAEFTPWSPDDEEIDIGPRPEEKVPNPRRRIVTTRIASA